jgi:hypothetical protein
MGMGRSLTPFLVVPFLSKNYQNASAELEKDLALVSCRRSSPSVREVVGHCPDGCEHCRAHSVVGVRGIGVEAGLARSIHQCLNLRLIKLSHEPPAVELVIPPVLHWLLQTPVKGLQELWISDPEVDGVHLPGHGQGSDA